MIEVNFITILSKLKVPLKTIIEMGSTRTPEKIDSLFAQQEKTLDTEMRRLIEAYSLIHIRQELLREGMAAKEGAISIRRQEEMNIVLGRPNIFRNGEPFYRPFMHFREDSDILRVNLEFPIGGRYTTMGAFVENPSEPERFFSFDSSGATVIPAGEYLVAYVRGYYWEMGKMPGRMAAYAKEHDLTCSGPVYVIYLHDEVCTKESTQYLARICVAIAPEGAPDMI